MLSNFKPCQILNNTFSLALGHRKIILKGLRFFFCYILYKEPQCLCIIN